MAAIRAGDRRGARKFLNYLLLHIYSAGEEHGELLKGMLLELVVMMARAAVEAGAPQSDVLGLNFRHLTELAGLHDEEEIAAWLRQAMERIFTVVETHAQAAPCPRIIKALGYLRTHAVGEVSRDEVARHAGVSSSHLSHLLRERTGRSFSELLRDFRIEAACELLRATDRTLADIALSCGFCDQSYFSHVFRQAKGMTPGRFREEVTPRNGKPHPGVMMENNP